MIEPNPATAGAVAEAKSAPADTHEVLEVAFKARRREYYANPKEIPLRAGDWVVVQADRGEDLGRVHHTHEWVKRSHLPGNLRPVLRPARPEDHERLEQNRQKEERALQTCKERVQHRDIEMKLVDCEYQFDGNRITFFFTAEKRVDFRDLVKDLASMFRTRIELRQIGVRDESGRIGGMGTCGRELCCATWLRDFEPITLKMAKDQGLSPSPSKISGACGRLKCCLRYELDFYKESAREFPKIGSRVELDGVDWEVGRVDIFHRTLRLFDETGKENQITLDEIPPGTKLVGPTRDRRKGCDKQGCGSRGARPGDGENPPKSAEGPRPGERPSRPERPERGPRPERRDRPDRGGRPDRGDRPERAARPDGFAQGAPPREGVPPSGAIPPRETTPAQGAVPPQGAMPPQGAVPPEGSIPPIQRRQLDGQRGRRRRRGRRDRPRPTDGGTGGTGGPSGGAPPGPGSGA